MHVKFASLLFPNKKNRNYFFIWLCNKIALGPLTTSLTIFKKKLKKKSKMPLKKQKRSPKKIDPTVKSPREKLKKI